MRVSAGRQKGALLLILAAVLILGGALAVYGSFREPATSDRDTASGQALQAAKEALLSYVVATAATSTEVNPGRLPCPEPLASAGGPNEGLAADPFDPVLPADCASVGRLPWKTLGLGQFLDGHEEPLWYAVATGTWARTTNTAAALIINPGTANSLTYDGAPNAVVAVIIAPGKPINTLNEPGSAAGCTPVAQHHGSYSAANFLECGNEAGNYRTGPAPWSNDRTITVTAAEVMQAIYGPVADRLQRQVGPALADWYKTESNNNWQNNGFLPYASPFTDPTTNDYCGKRDPATGQWGTMEGLLPSASSSTSACTNWTSWNIGGLGPLSIIVPGGTCTPRATALRCTFWGIRTAAGLLSVRISATAPNVTAAFRKPLRNADIVVVQPSTGSASNVQNSLDYSTGNLNFSVDISTTVSAFALLQNFVVDIPYLPDASIMSDARMAWFLNNRWDRFTYYALGQGVSARPGVTQCDAPGDSGCLNVTGLPTTGSTDKRFVLISMGPKIPPQTRTCPGDRDGDGVPDCHDVKDYLESRVSPTQFNSAAVTYNYNDRLAACPFQYRLAGVSGPALCSN